MARPLKQVMTLPPLQRLRAGARPASARKASPVRTTKRVLTRRVDHLEADSQKLQEQLAAAREALREQKDKTAHQRKLATQQRKLATQRQEQLIAAEDRLTALDLASQESIKIRKVQRTTPSFRQQYHDMRRTTRRAIRIDPDCWHPYRQLKLKLRNYQFAASHGVGIPRVYAVWDDIDDIDLEGLPETFAFKSDFGSGSRGVFLLRRVAPGRYETLDTGTAMTVTDLRAALEPHLKSRRVRGPYFAEEALIEPDGGVIPADVKIYSCYGRIAQVMLRTVTDLSDPESRAMRFLDADAQDVGDVMQDHDIDPHIAIPDTLPGMLSAVRHLSRGLGTPFCRIDMYSTTRGLVLGELTLTPGSSQVYTPEHDARMGAVWEDAQVERDLDLRGGRPFGILHGSHPTPILYPPDHISRSVDTGPWTMTRVDCEQWCFGPADALPERGGEISTG